MQEMYLVVMMMVVMVMEIHMVPVPVKSNENQEKMVLVSPFAVLKYLPLTSLSTSRVDSTF